MKLPKEPFKYKDVMREGLTRYELNKLLETNKVVRMGHGIYRRSDVDLGSSFDVEKFLKISARADENSYIGLWSALEFYQLTDEFVEKVWIFVPYSKIIRDDDCKVIRKRNFDKTTGISKHNGYNLSNLERTLIDCFLNKRHVLLKDSLSFCRVAIKEGKTTPSKVVRMAKSMGVFERISEYLGLVL